MRLTGFEIRKLFSQKSFLVILVICAVANILVLGFQESASFSYTPRMYLSLMENVSDLPLETARTVLREDRDELWELEFSEGISEYEEQKELLTP